MEFLHQASPTKYPLPGKKPQDPNAKTQSKIGSAEEAKTEKEMPIDQVLTKIKNMVK